MRQGYEPGEIVVLSPLSEAVAGLMEPPWKGRMKALEAAGASDIRFSTIAAFKGLKRRRRNRDRPR